MKEKNNVDFLQVEDTQCTNKRRLFINRCNDIFLFYMTTGLASQVLQREIVQQLISQKEKGNVLSRIVLNTEIQSKLSSIGIVTDQNSILMQNLNNRAIIARQAFVMLYGSFETYLYDMFQMAYKIMGHTDDIHKRAIEILMKNKWKGKFSRINQEFEVAHRDKRLCQKFSKLKLIFDKKQFHNPLDLLDHFAQVRHRIVHASSITDDIFIDKIQSKKLKKGELLSIASYAILPVYNFYVLLSEYVDIIFSQKYKIGRKLYSNKDQFKPQNFDWEDSHKGFEF